MAALWTGFWVVTRAMEPRLENMNVISVISIFIRKYK
jgi:hypothetical protein